jgi:hypothetical protein
MHQGATCSSESRVARGRQGSMEHGHVLSQQSVSTSPSRRHAQQDVALGRQVPTSWGDVVWSVVLEGGACSPHSLHTAEVTD